MRHDSFYFHLLLCSFNKFFFCWFNIFWSYGLEFKSPEKRFFWLGSWLQKQQHTLFWKQPFFLEGLCFVGKGGKISNIFFLFSCYLQKIVLIISQSFPCNSRVLLLRQLCKRQLFDQIFNCCKYPLFIQDFFL